MLLIDAYNVLHTVGVLPRDLAGLEVEDLAELVSVGRYRGRRALVVCDGTPRPGGLREGFRAVGGLRWEMTGGSVEVVFAGVESDADTFIEKYIEAETAPKRLLVVSSDRRVLRAGRKRRAGVLDSVEFLRQMVFDAEAGLASTGLAQQGGLRGQVPLKQAAIAYWKEVFGVAGDGAEKPAPEVEIDLDDPELQELLELGPGAKSKKSDASEDPKERAADDPELRKIVEEWSEEVDIDDLDMDRWMPPPQS